MLQIITGKFFKNIKTRKVSEKTVYYSNLTVPQPIKTSVGTLEYLTIRPDEISQLLLTLDGEIWDGYRALNYPEASEQFKNIFSFYFETIIDNDKQNAVWLCRDQWKYKNELLLPSKILPQYFEDKWCRDNGEKFNEFLDKILNLPRKTYKSVMNSITTYNQAINLVNYDLELAYSLMIYSLESLSYSNKKLDIQWKDYDITARNKIEQFFNNTKIKKEEQDELKNILLNYSFPKAKFNFKEFCKNNITEDYFKEESKNVIMPLRKSELERCLNNAYKYRSDYVHRLEKIDDLEKHFHITNDVEVFDKNGDCYLTFRGLTRLTHHIIKNFVINNKYVEYEEINWLMELPGFVYAPLSYEYWIKDAEKIKEEDIFRIFPQFLISYTKKFRNINLDSIKIIIEKMKEKIPHMKKDHKLLWITFSYFFSSITTEDKPKNWNDSKYKKELNKLTIENLVTKLILKEEINWTLEDVVKLYEEYKTNKHTKNNIALPLFVEIKIILYISNEYLKVENYKNQEYWLNEAILDLPSKVNCQDYLEEHINSKTSVDLEKFNELLINKKV